MKESLMYAKGNNGISGSEIFETVRETVNNIVPKSHRILIISPDNTRLHSFSRELINMYYELLSPDYKVDILIALGTHMKLSEKEISDFFGQNIPLSCIHQHDWRNDTIKIGEVPLEYVEKISAGKYSYPIEVEINKCLKEEPYDLIISVGQVVPHELVGMANYSKNIFIGIGGYNTISKTHIMGPLCDVEMKVGEINNPVRKVFDYAHEHFLMDLPLLFVLTVITLDADERLQVEGLFIGNKRIIFEKAAALSYEKNVIKVDKPIKKLITYMDDREYRTTWLADKAVQRTRTIIADGGEIVIVAPGVIRFGDDEETDKVMRKYGYVNKNILIKHLNDPDNPELRNNLPAAGQLMMTTSNERFTITYAVKKENMTKEEIENMSLGYIDYNEAIEKYDFFKLKEGYNTLKNGELVYFIKNPSLGFWTLSE